MSNVWITDYAAITALGELSAMRNAECGMRNPQSAIHSPHSAFRIPHSLWPRLLAGESAIAPLTRFDLL
jgi:hypothetical protein